MNVILGLDPRIPNTVVEQAEGRIETTMQKKTASQ